MHYNGGLPTRTAMSKIIIKLPAAKHRAHRVLFQDGSPFKSRTVQGKPVYNRHKKHRGRDENG